MKDRTWTIGDILDLEFYLRQRSMAEDQQKFVQKDRELYLKNILPEIDPGDADAVHHNRNLLLKRWLEAQKKLDSDTVGKTLILPGAIFNETLKLLTIWFFISGSIFGIGLCLSWFSYTGAQPLNVSYFIGVAVFFQLMLLVFFIFSFILARQGGLLLNSWVPYPVLTRLVRKLLLKFNKKLLGRIPGEKRDRIAKTIGLIQSGHTVYGFLFFWPFCILVQFFGLAVNLGVLSTLVFRILFFDTAFGWQSTVQFSAAMVHKLVSIIALPWAWFVPESIACPTLSQIEGSRMVLKSGIYHLATQDLVSWWPFLCFCVVFYGLLPRLVLLVAGKLILKKELAGQQFTHGECERIFRNMITPIVSTQSDQKSNEETTPSPAGMLSETVPFNPNGFIVLIPDDIYDDCDFDLLNHHVQLTLGSSVQKVLRIGMDIDKDLMPLKQLITEVESNGALQNFPGVLILQEAWRPPINEIRGIVTRLRKDGRQRMPLIIGLVGRPRPESLFTVPDSTDLKIWNVKMAILGDPYLRIESLVKA